MPTAQNSSADEHSHRPSQSVETISIGRLRAYPGNARTHPIKQIRQIAKSIEKFGFTNPVLVSDDNEIIAGHGRVEAAKLLGWDNVPILRLSHLDAAQRRSYVIADNKLALVAGWDRNLLASELQGLIDIKFDVTLLGFETAEIDLLFEEIGQERADAPAEVIPAYATGLPVTASGDLWILGEHRLLCGDARKSDAYQKLLSGELAEFVFTDPPYNVPIDGHVCGLGRIRHKNFAMGCGEMDKPAFSAFLAGVFQQLAKHSRDGAIHDICMDWRHMPEMLEAGYHAYSELKNLCVWNKPNAGMGSFYRSKHELVFVWKSGSGKHINNFELGQHGRTRSNVWDYAGPSSLQQEGRDHMAMHPTVKPVALVADAIRDCSRRGGLVLDPFAGSGTVLIACEMTGRSARAIEIDPGYVDVAVQRWQSYRRETARLLATGKSFDDVAAQRRVEQQCL